MPAPALVWDAMHEAGDSALVAGVAALEQLADRATIPAYLLDHLEPVLRDAARRKARQRLLHWADALYTPNGDGRVRTVPEIAEEATDALRALALHAVPAARESLFKVRTLRELRQAEIPEPEFHVDKWIRRRGVTYIVGDSEAYKSWFAQYVGMCIAAGVPVLGEFAVRKTPVLYVSEENGEIEDRRRADLLCRGMGFDDGIPFYVASETLFRLDDDARYAALCEFIERHGIGIVIFDSFVRVHRIEEKDAGAVNALYQDKMQPLMKRGTDLWFLHHRRKLPPTLAGGGRPVETASDNDDIRGSGDIRAGAFSILLLKLLTDSTVVVKHNKARGWRKQAPYVMSVKDTDGHGIVLGYEGAPKDALDKTDACKAAILEYAAEHRAGFFRGSVIEALKGKFSKKVIDKALAKASEGDYPLKAEQYREGRSTKKLFVLVLDDPAEAREPGDDDVPF